jgi:hypothetical protein
MDSSQAHIFLAYPQFYIFHTAAVGSAISLFLIFYIRNLILQAEKDAVVKPVSLPVWLNFMYPNWLDKLTFQHIFKAFAWGLGIAIVSWIVLAILFLIVIMKVYGP